MLGTLELDDWFSLALDISPPWLTKEPLWPESKLRNYQVYLAGKVEEIPAVMFAVEMSLGKTAASLTGMRRLLRARKIKRLLVVAPLEVAKNTWPDELEQWAHLQDLTWTKLSGLTPDKRAIAAREDTEVHIINRENFPWLQLFWGENWPYDALIWDESSRFKSGKKRTTGGKNRKKGAPVPLTEFGACCRIRKHLKHIVLLTGTPAPNGLHDLWGQFYVIDFGKRLGNDLRAFERRWFSSDYMGWNLTPYDHSEGEIMGLVKDVMIGLRAEDYIELPPRVRLKVWVDLTPSELLEYKRFERTLVAEAYDVEAVSKGVLTNKLLQFANGSLYRPIEGTEDRETLHVHDHKIVALKRIVEEAAGANILLAYSYEFDLARIKKFFPHAIAFDDDPNFVKNWNAGKIALGLAHPGSIGHGLNLQKGGHIQVWYGLTWSLELYDQFNRRLARSGQSNEKVFIYHIMARGTKDDVVYESMNTRGATQDSITNAVRVRILEAA